MPHNRGIRLPSSRIEEFVLNINEIMLVVYKAHKKYFYYLKIDVGNTITLDPFYVPRRGLFVVMKSLKPGNYT